MKTAISSAVSVPVGGSFLLEPVAEGTIFTPSQFDPQQKALRDVARRLEETEILPKLERIEAKEPGLMRDLLEKAGEQGLLMLSIPEKYGGLGQGKATMMLVTEAFSRCPSFAVSVGAHVGIGTLPLLYFGTEEQKKRYLPKLATGEWIAAYALTEPDSGSDALAARTTATLAEDGSHYLLNGAKQWITNAGFADLFVVFAQLEDAGFSAFLVERTSPGLTVGPEEHKHGIQGSSTCALAFHDVAIPLDNLLGQPGEAHRIAFNILNVGRARLGIGTLGGAKALLGIATQYGNERRQFGKTLTEFGLIRSKLGEMASRIFAGESLSYRVAGMMDGKFEALRSEGVDLNAALQGSAEEYAIEASIMKVFGSEVLDYTADEAQQIHGGYGYMVGYIVERAVRDARINRIFEGTNEINRLLLVGTLLKRAMRGKIPLLGAVAEIEASLGKGQEPTAEEQASFLGGLERHVQRMRSATLIAVSHAVKRFGTAIEEEQATLAALADMMIDTFAADSAVRRTLQGGETGPNAAFFLDCASVFTHQARDRVLGNARNVSCAALEGKDLETALEKLALLDQAPAFDLFSARDRVAERVIARGAWPLDP
jgi:alkylation response protein AidB-like acyl-CoA dehydrogenase